MGGGILQLIIKGKMDQYLTGNPEHTFFKAVYRRHTNFSIESIKQQVTNTGIGERHIKSTISRSGDLLGNIMVEVKLDRGDAENISHDGTYLNWVNNTGHAFIKQCEIEIGGKVIDRHHSDWMDVYNEVYDINEQEFIGINKHPGKRTYFKKGSRNIVSEVLKLYIPLYFWFCKNPGLYLPIIAITKHDININLITRSIEYLFNADGELSFSNNIPAEVDLWCDYVFLDQEEKRKFIKDKRAYLIEHVQRSETDIKLINKISFNHPVKELFWIVQSNIVKGEYGNGSSNIDTLMNISGQEQVNGNDYFNYQSNTDGDKEVIFGYNSFESFRTAKLCLNGIDRFYERDASYFRIVQPLNCKHKLPSKHIYLYSFSLNPSEFQPSGSCNFSKIDDAELVLTSNQNYTNEKLIVFAINYNVLVVSNGMAGIVYN